MYTATVKRHRAAESEKSLVLEAMAAKHRLTRRQAAVLAAIGISVGDHAGHTERPWGRDDDAIVRRLTRARGWSPAAIAAFLHRPVAQVEASLAPVP